jgi:uncharacterized protein (DUF1800 family)
MSQTIPLPSPERAWVAFDTRRWDENCAKHLLRRLGFSATPASTALALREGPEMTVRRAFASVRPMPMPRKLENLSEESTEIRAKLKSLSVEERKEFVKELRRKNEAVVQDYAVAWLEFSRRPELSAQEKFVLFLQDIFVVTADKIKRSDMLFDYQATLRKNISSDYATMLRAVMKHPAMFQFLDADKNTKGQPNENFARELFELFSLGEGNYTEKDVKEAARALTGANIRNGVYTVSEKQHDNQEKTIFGKKGNWGPDDLVDITVAQPASAAYAPQELIKFYLAAEGLPREYAVSFGKVWRANGMRLSELPRILFNSEIFYHPKFRGNFIKSPIAYYLGLCQDLGIDVIPYPGPIVNALRAMGQSFYNPPNVRGWIYGRNWISSSSLAARRAVARNLFVTIPDEKLNADDLKALKEARAAGHGNPTVTSDRLEFLAKNRTDAEIVVHFCNYFLPAPVSPEYRKVLEEHIQSDGKGRIRSIEEAVTGILQSPLYQLS